MFPFLVWTKSLNSVTSFAVLLYSEPSEWDMLKNSNEKFLVSAFIHLLGFPFFTQSPANIIKCSDLYSLTRWPHTSWWPGINIECSYVALGAQSDISFPAVKSSDVSDEGNQKQGSDSSGSPLPALWASNWQKWGWMLGPSPLDPYILGIKTCYFLQPWHWRWLYWHDEEFRF